MKENRTPLTNFFGFLNALALFSAISVFMWLGGIPPVTAMLLWFCSMPIAAVVGMSLAGYVITRNLKNSQNSYLDVVWLDLALLHPVFLLWAYSLL